MTTLRQPGGKAVRKPGQLADTYRSICKICQLSIHAEAAVWSRRPLGLIHATCASNPEATPL